MLFSARRLLPLLLIALPQMVLAGEVALDAPEEIVELLEPYLPEDVGSTQAQKLSREILSTEGYFSPLFEIRETDGELSLKIDPGPRTKITTVNVTVDGKIDPKIRDEVIASWSLPVGQAFRQDDWSSAKTHLPRPSAAQPHTGSESARRPALDRPTRARCGSCPDRYQQRRPNGRGEAPTSQGRADAETSLQAMCRRIPTLS